MALAHDSNSPIPLNAIFLNAGTLASPWGEMRLPNRFVDCPTNLPGFVRPEADPTRIGKPKGDLPREVMFGPGSVTVKNAGK